MEWVVPAVNGVVPAARHSHRAETMSGDTMLVFAGSGQNEALDDLFHFKISCVPRSPRTQKLPRLGG